MASPPILNPELPYVGMVEGGLFPGKMVKVQGRVPPDAIRFAINYQLGPTLNPRDDIAIHVCPRFTEGFITRNHIQSMTWGHEENFGDMVIQPGQEFEIIILCDHRSFKVAINGQHFADFRYRLPYQKVTHLVVDGDVDISSIFFEVIPIGPPPSGSMEDVPEANFGPPQPGGVYPTIHPGGSPPGNYDPTNDRREQQLRYEQAQKEEEDNAFMDKIGLAVGGLVAAGGAAALASALHKRQQQQKEGEKDHEKSTKTENESGFGGLGSLGAALASSLAANAMQRNSHSNYPAYPSLNSGGGMLGNLLGALGGGGGGHGAPPPSPYGHQSNSDSLGGALSGILGGVLGGGGGSHQQPGYQPSGGYGQPQQQQQQQGSSNFLGGIGAALGSSLLSSALDSFNKPKDKHRDDDYYRPPDRTQSYDHRYDPAPPAPPSPRPTSVPRRPSPPPPSSGGGSSKLTAAEISKGLGLGDDDD